LFMYVYVVLLVLSKDCTMFQIVVDM